MKVISVSRSYGSGGSLFARRVAEVLGFSYVDEDFIRRTKRDESMALALLENIEDEASPDFGKRVKELLDNKSFFMTTLAASIYDFVLNNDVVIVGGGAHIILEGYPAMVSVQVVRRLSERARDIAAEKNISFDAALDLTERKDKDKRKFIRYYFDKELFDPLQFHFVMNAGLVTLSQGVDTISRFTSEFFASVDREDAERFLQGRLAEKKAELLLFKLGITRDLGKITFHYGDEGVLTVKGVIGSEKDKERLFVVLKGMKVVTSIDDHLKVGILSRAIY